ncbi:MAG: hypothetical protein CMC33_01425 [Flavobacteriaceae bacterium]|nr:hypothetical protein [Flavobacteriaceae bacterium]
MKNSYLKIDNAISVNSSKKLFKYFIRLINFYEPNFNRNKIKFSGWEDEEFNNKLIDLRKKDKKKFSSIYDTMKLSNVLNYLPYENKLQKIASKFLDINEDKLGVRGIQFRIDVPNDKRNVYGWHQDNAYDNFNINSKNGVIFWIPLINTNKKNGTLIVKPGSEFSNSNCSYVKSKTSKFKSQQILVKKKFLEKYKDKHVSVKRRQALLTYSGIFHKSGENISNKIRFTIIMRYNNIFSKDFMYYRNLKKQI